MTFVAMAESISARYNRAMTDDLVWKLGARIPGHDYRVFRTAFVDGAHRRPVRSSDSR